MFQWHLQDGITETSAVTTLSRPRLDRAPRTTPHEKARYCRKTQGETNQDQLHEIISDFLSCMLDYKMLSCSWVLEYFRPWQPGPDTPFHLRAESGEKTCYPAGHRYPVKQNTELNSTHKSRYCSLNKMLTRTYVKC